MRSEVVVRARASWTAGKPLEAGRLICEALPDTERPRWAGELLAVVYLWACRKGRARRVPAIEHVLAITSDARRWIEARDALVIVRSLLLDAQRRAAGETSPDLLVPALLGLAEVVAKVTYNAAGSDDPFERNAGWRVATGLRPVLDALADPGLEAACVAHLLCETPRP